MILSLLLYLYEATLKKYKYFRRFLISALTFYFTKKADKMQVLFKINPQHSLYGGQLVEKVFFDKLLDCEKHTQTRKESPSAYKGTVGDS